MRQRGYALNHSASSNSFMVALLMKFSWGKTAQFANMIKDCNHTSISAMPTWITTQTANALLTDTHLAVACAASFVLSFSVFGRGIALGAVASLLSTACPAGQRRGGLADCPLPTWMLRLGRPLKTWQGGRGHWLLFLLQRPLTPGEIWIIT